MTATAQPGVPAAVRWWLIACSVAALVWTMTARVAGPSDLWDQSQPSTVSYTTDVIANGRWILPRERGTRPATKPPLYNWLAVPTVRAFGFPSELGHKFPSVVALALCWLAIVRWGRALSVADLGPAQSELIGWLAGMLFVANYAIFKLGYLARPDMLLTLWLLLGWMAATAVLTCDGERPRDRPPRWPALAFWICTGLAGLTKGPAALCLPLYALAAAPFLGGSWRAAGRFGWWWGVPLSLLFAGAWVWAAWRIDPAHVRDELWFNEIYGRVTGLGAEGSRSGPFGLVERLVNMPIYFVIRFLPWSFLVVGGMLVLWRRGAADSPRRWRRLGAGGRRLQGAAIFTIVVVAFYTFSAGKRADYIAAAYGPGAVLAAWWAVRSGALAIRRAAWGLPALTLAVLAALTVNNERRATDFGEEIMEFAREARVVMEATERPVGYWNTGVLQIQAMVGGSAADTTEAVLAVIDAGEPCWVVAGGRIDGGTAFEVWLPRERPGVSITPVVRSRVLPERGGWLIQVTLYLVQARR